MPASSVVPFTEQVRSPEWRRAVLEWIEEALTLCGYRVRGPLIARRYRPWSMHLVVPTDHADVWFKATCPAMSFEPGVHALIARLAPEVTEPPLAVDPERGWMLTLQHARSAVDRSADPPQWRDLVDLIAPLQQRLAAHREEFLAAGLPDGSPRRVLQRFDHLVEELASLPPRHPSALGVAGAELLRARRGELAEAVAALEQTPFPVTFQHADLHPENAYRSAGRLRIFDFGDAQWACAVETLAVPFAIMRTQEPDLWRGLVDAYREAWDVDPTSFGVAWNAAHYTHAVNRACTWWRCLQFATREEWERWGDAPLAHLREMMRS